MNNILVSVSLITYNHEPFIQASIKSILSQQTNFDFEIVVGEDFSTDNTRAILLRLQKEYPGKIRIIERPGNIGSTKNFSDTLLQCTGEFIAMMDGDDEMLPGKLQAEVDFLKAHPECTMVGHDMKIWNESKKKFTGEIKCRINENQEIYELTDLVRYGSFISNSSKMFRRNKLSEEPVDLRVNYIADYYFTLKYVKPGDKIGVINRPLGVYRVHPNNTMLNLNARKNLYDLLLAQRYLTNTYNKKYTHLYKRVRAYATWLYGKEFFLHRNYKKAYYFFRMSYKYYPFVNKSQVVFLIKSFVKSRVKK